MKVNLCERLAQAESQSPTEIDFECNQYAQHSKDGALTGLTADRAAEVAINVARARAGRRAGELVASAQREGFLVVALHLLRWLIGIRHNEEESRANQEQDHQS